MSQKILVECELPKDYCLSNVYYSHDIEQLHLGDIYLISNQKKLSKCSLQEDGFTYISENITTSFKFNIEQCFETEQGIWKSIFCVSITDGNVDRLYEVSTELSRK